ncbi:MAG: DNA primase [Candidatus Levybacteria bacterium]|nr:DNA primase [Candidatus Levybacteria bacterium]
MDDVDLIKQKIDVADLIANYIPTKRAGRNFKANCPFHNEKSASFVISPERQIWHCFGCQKGGDIFTFIEEYERVDFSEALKILAEKANVKLTKNVFRTGQDEKKSRIYEINHLSSLFYHYLLTEHSSGKEALSYVTEKRGLTPALLSTYGIGFAPRQGNALINYLSKKKGYSNEELLEAGVASSRGGRLYDFFQNRIIFPIQDSRGNIIAFSGRGLTDNAIPKYINTKETPVYIKGDTVFGLYQAKESIKKEGKVILMEGEFDVISSFKEGITNTIAIKGTALTENQIKLLKRFAQKIVFCFDTDPAGTEAQRRSIALITKEGINASVVIPPQGKDPDELLSENPALFKKALKDEINIYDFILESAVQNEDPKSVEGKKHILSRTLSYITDIENEIVKEHYMKKLATLLDTSYESVIKEADKARTPLPIAETKPKQLEKRSRQEMMEEHLLTLVLQSQDPKSMTAVVASILDPIELTTPHAHTIFQSLKKYFLANDELKVSEISTTLAQDLVSYFDMYFLNPIPHFPTEETYIHEIEKTTNAIKQSSIKKRLEKLSEQMKKEEGKGNEEELQKLRVEFNSLATSYK